jgi:glycosyltransferase involved in cell wall biosynthesis
MNVVLATPTWSLNGPNVFSASLVRGLKVRNIPARIVLTRPDWLDPKPLPRPPDVPIEKLEVSRFVSFSARCGAMIRYLEQRSPCVYIPNYDVGHSCISPRLPPSVAIVGIVHSDDSQHYEHVARLGGYWNAVVAVSSAIAGETRRIAPALAARLSVIPYGVGVAAAFPERNSGARPLRVVYAGRLDQPQKRVLDLVGIVQAAAELGVQVLLTIVGSGPAEAQLKARIGCNQSVEFLGTMESDALARLLAGQDVFLLTSVFEGLPIGVLEAMGQGCIPVVSDVRSGIPELIEDGVEGFRVPIGDIRGVATRLAELHNKESMRRRMAEAAFTKAGSGCYRLDHMVESYAELFGTVLDDARRGAFRRPAGKIRPPSNLPWPERLPGVLQRWGHGVKQLLTRLEATNSG